MARTVSSGIAVSGPGGVTMTLSPPLEFIEKQYGSFRLQLENLQPLWRRFAVVLGEIETQQFDTQGHGAWPPLSEETIARKRDLGFPADPLIRTGRLKNSFGSIQTNNTEMLWGTGVEYAGYHQTGGGSLPKRELIPDPLPTGDRRLLETEVVAFINASARAAFGKAAA